MLPRPEGEGDRRVGEGRKEELEGAMAPACLSGQAAGSGHLPGAAPLGSAGAASAGGRSLPRLPSIQQPMVPMTQFSTRLNPAEGTGGLVRLRVCVRERAVAKEKPAPALFFR